MSAYPRHMLTGPDRENQGKTKVTCAEPMVPPKQLGIAAPGRLYCLGCQGTVAVGADELAQAEEAMREEGTGELVRGPVTPGALDEKVRAILYAGIWEAKDRPALAALGFVDDENHLTAAGLAMRAQIRSPAVDLSALRFDPAHAPKPTRQKKERPPKPRVDTSIPLTCRCSHGARAHLTSAGNDAGCNECGCSGYLQARAGMTLAPVAKASEAPAVPAKPRKARAKKAVAP